MQLIDIKRLEIGPKSNLELRQLERGIFWRVRAMRKKNASPRLLDVYAVIGNNIRRLRGTMTLQELARLSGVAKGTLVAIEHGNGSNLETLIKIADALNISAADLFITDDQRKEVTYQHVLLMGKLKESLTVNKS